MSPEYDSNYGDGDETDLLKDETGQRRSNTINVTEDLESKLGELFESQHELVASKNNALEWKIKALAVSGMALFICSLGILAFCVIQQLNIENLSDTGAQVRTSYLLYIVL